MKKIEILNLSKQSIRDILMDKGGRLKFEFCRGSNSGKAIYLGNRRVSGEKCWGVVKTEFEGGSLSVSEIDKIISILKKEKASMLRTKKQVEKYWEIEELTNHQKTEGE